MEDFNYFIKVLAERLRQPLPGPAAHESMRAMPSGSVIPNFEHKLPPKPGSVMILLYKDASGLVRFPLIKRPDYLGAHSGQVSFPGGKAEAGETAVQAALRETEEEIGLNRNLIRVVGSLSDFFVMPSNFMVTPVVGMVEAAPQFVPDSVEVSRILYGDLNQILPDTAIRTKEIVAASKYKMIAPHFEIEGEVVWGATAMMLNEFRTVVREII